MSYSLRRNRLLQALTQRKIPALLVSNLPDVRWLTGFTGSNAAVAVIPGKHSLKMQLFTDSRYTQQAAEETEGASVNIAKKAAAIAAAEWLLSRAVPTCAYDSAVTTVDTLSTLKKATSARFLKSAKGLLPRLRELKDEQEIEHLRAAAELGCQIYNQALGLIEPGMTEIEVAADIEYLARHGGAEAMSFETIVASGPRGALPHGRASGRKLGAGEMVTLDFGVILGGYCSDMTRTVYLGGAKENKRQRAVFEAVLEAQETAVAAVKAGVKASDVDEAARSVLRKAGLEKEFSHSTGHGLGLEIHEGPRVGAKSEEVLQAGMVITIEPGAYLDGKFGVRIEDTVLVTEKGCEVLTPAPKIWIEL